MATPRASKLRLKAEYIRRFASFARWPASALAEKTSLVLCVEGQPRLFASLQAVVVRGPIQGHPVEVRSVQSARLSVASVAGCHLLFLSESARHQLGPLLVKIRQQPMLTVGSSRDFAARGVMLNLYRQGRYMRFEINRAALEAAGLRLPARVLRLGREVP